MRAWTELINDWPAFRANALYPARVVDLLKQREAPAIKLILELLDHGQAGRRLDDMRLPTPIRPAGLTADFFQACGIEVVAGKRIRPKDVIGRTVCVRFDPNSNQPVEFRKPDNPPELKQLSSMSKANPMPEHKSS